jgi:hypothetical protein
MPVMCVESSGRSLRVAVKGWWDRDKYKWGIRLWEVAVLSPIGLVCVLLYPLWEFLALKRVGYSCMFSFVSEGSLLRSQDVLSIFRAFIAGFCCGCAEKHCIVVANLAR